MNSYKKAMGKRIKECRRKLGLTQETAAEELGISVKHFSEVERGIAGLSVDNLIRLSALLGVSLDYIVKGEANANRWEGVVLLLQSVPEEKENQLTELIKTAVKLVR